MMMTALVTTLAPAALARDFGFEAEYIDCDEFAGVGVVALADVEHLVPDDYTIVTAGPGTAVVVAQAGSCEEITVGGRGRRAGIFAQFGVSVVPPTGASTAGSFYQLAFVTNHARLFARMRRAGVAATFAPRMAYTITEDSDTTGDLFIDVPRPAGFAWTIDGPITLPDPEGEPNPLTTFDYWTQSRRTGNVLQRNDVSGIRFGAGPEVRLTAEGCDLQDIVGVDPFAFPFFSNPEVFDVTDLTVTTDVF